MGKDAKITPKDCLACGACCVSLQDQDAFCDIDPADLERLGRPWVRRNVLMSSTFDAILRAIDGTKVVMAAIRTSWRKQRSGPLKGVDACVCVALRGSLMHAVRCSVYEKRPQACRVAVVPGDRTCVDLRRMFLDLIEETKVTP